MDAPTPTTCPVQPRGLHALLAALRDPKTVAGTARWAGVVACLADIARNHVTSTNAALLLALAGLPSVLGFFVRPADPAASPAPAFPEGGAR